MRLWCLLDRYAGANGEAFPSRARLCADLGDISLSSLDRAVADLCRSGWLAKERRFKGGPNDYTVLVVPVEVVPEESLRPLSSPMTTGGVVTHDEGVSSPMTTGVVTHDDHKEASSKDPQRSDPSSLRSEGPDEASGDTVTAKGTRLSADWQPSERLKDWFRDDASLHSRVNPIEETARFVDYWIAVPGARGTKRNWDATWRNWIRRAAQGPAERTAAAPQHPDSSPQHIASRSALF